MNYSTTEQAINKTLSVVLEAAAASSGYKPGGNIALFLEHVVSTMTHSAKIEDLWGPEWSLFIVMVADRTHPTVGSENVVSDIKEVLRRMVGRAATSPASAIATLTGLSVNEVELSDEASGSTKQQHVELVVKICNELNIPSPLEVLCMYSALEDAACPAGAAKLYRFKPNANKPITEDDMSSMVALMRAKESVVQAGTQAKEAVKQTEQSLARYQQEMLKIIQTSPDTKQAVKRTEQVTVQYRREVKEIARVTAEAFRVTVQAERSMANAALRQYKENVVVFVEQLTSTPNKR